MDKLKWDRRFLDLARKISEWSKDPSTKVGAVVADKKTIVSVGYNGLPSNITDTDEILSNRALKYRLIIHAEINALNFAARDIQGCTIYTYPFMPCHICADTIIKSGITRVVSFYSINPRWVSSFNLTRTKLKKHRIELTEYEDFFQIKS